MKFFQAARQIVARTDFFPFRPVYGACYRAGVAYLERHLRRFPGLRALYLAGSYAQGKHLHGASDVDFFVLLDYSQRHRARELAHILRRCARLFPFLGPVSERANQVLLCGSEGEVEDLYFLYRLRQGRLKALLEQPGFKPKGLASPAIETSAELNLQLRMVVEAVRAERDHPYFWKRRLAALGEMAGAPELDSELRALLDAPDRELYASTDSRLKDRCLDWFLGACEAVRLRLAQGMTMPYRACAAARPPNQPGFAPLPVCQPFRREALADAALLRLPGFLISLADPRTAEVRAVQAVFSWQPTALLGFAESTMVLNRWEAPWLFGDSTLDSELWEWMRRRGQQTRHSLAEQLEQGEKSLLESDWGLLQALLASWMLARCVVFDPLLRLKNEAPFPDSAAVIADLTRHYPEQEPFLRQVSAYGEALERGEGHLYSGSLPSNFIGHLIACTRALLRDIELPPIENLYLRLSLSLCIVTREREGWLRELLQSVLTQSRLPDEVVLVDNGPAQGARAIADEFAALPIRYVAQAEGSLGQLRNRAMAESTGEIICFTDDDCLLDPHWLGHAERSFLRDSRIGAVGGRIRHLYEKDTAVDRFHQIYLG